MGGSVFRLAKIGRLIRLVRFLRVAKVFPSLRALNCLVTALAHTHCYLMSLTLMMMGIMYAFATVLTIGATDHRRKALADPFLSEKKTLDDVEYWWGSLLRSIYTLFLCVTGGAEWRHAAVSLSHLGDLYLFVFMLFITFIYFAVANVITGVFVESAIAIAARDQENMMHHFAENERQYSIKLKKLFTEDSGESFRTSISLEDFEGKLREEKTRKFFAALDLEISDAKWFFTFLDSEGTNCVNIDELLLGCMRMKGGAKATDMLRVLQDSKKVVTGMKQIEKFLEERFGVKATPDEWILDFMSNTKRCDEVPPAGDNANPISLRFDTDLREDIETHSVGIECNLIGDDGDQADADLGPMSCSVSMHPKADVSQRFVPFHNEDAESAECPEPDVLPSALSRSTHPMPKLRAGSPSRPIGAASLSQATFI